MKQVNHPTNTRTLQAPKGWNHDDLPCDALPVTDMLAGGLPCVVSFWRPERAELEALAAGRPVVLSIVGAIMPPVMLAVEANVEAAPAAVESTGRNEWKEAVIDALAAWPGMDFTTDTPPSTIIAAILKMERQAAVDLSPAATPAAPSAGVDAERALFEATMAVRSPGCDFHRFNEDNYSNRAVHHSWDGWMARAALAQPAPVLEAAGDASDATALAAVMLERRRQVDVEGWTPEHDDGHVNDEIAALACFYAMPPGAREWPATETGYGHTLGAAIVPEGWEAKEGDRWRELVKAGALILAEAARHYRAERKAQEVGARP
ncbi:hypothetical protein [Variovorax boronicumulans]|uniref:hypothetical protein n=1 Tax=Variovorax boronicumulans TaxID=436515 RepID=UPI00197CF9FA|nr:hypothetical protein [Variovorax boronicumulans]